VIGAGHVYGPYAQTGATMDVYRWKVNAQPDIPAVLAQIAPWYSLVKKRQADRVLSVLQAQSPLPRGRPDWGNRKTHCVNGHEYAIARVRPYVPRGVGTPRRDNQLCLVCLRDYARKQREKIGGK